MTIITDIPSAHDEYTAYITYSLSDTTKCAVPSNEFDDYDYTALNARVDAHVKERADTYKAVVSDMVKDSNGSV